MGFLNSLFAIIFALFLIWMLYRYLRSNPEALSWANINKSMYSLGILAVVLIAFLGIVVWLLQQ